MLLIVALLGVSYYLLGKIGLQTISMWLFLYIVPSYLILLMLGLEESESFVIAIFGTAGVVPALIFFMNYIIPSLRASAIILWVIELVLVFVVYKYHYRK
ncbi:hypothetical protein J4227_03675 [Candidatus Woesearchaeota archaeon]|nr:hypothetical protein [Candidatus Woesearchaeota archaeon]